MSRFGRTSKQELVNRASHHNGNGRRTMPAVTKSPADTPLEVDHETEEQYGSKSKRRGLRPLRFFPQQFPVPTVLYGILTIAAGVALLTALFYDVREVLSPFLLAITVTILLYPFRKEPKLRPLLIVAGLVFMAWFVSTTFMTLLPFILAFLLAYIIDPLITWLQRKYYIKRWILALTFSALLVATIAIVMGYMVPVFVAQFGTALSSLDRVANSVIEWARNGGVTEIIGIPQPKVDQMIERYIEPKLAGLQDRAFESAEGVGTALPALLAGLINFLMIPFLMFYLIKDYWHIRASIYSFIPQEYQRRSQHLLNDLHEVVGGFLRGDLITSVFQGLFIGIGLFVIGVPGALMLGVVTGVLSLIPYVGAVVAYVLAVIAALTIPDPAMPLLYVTILFAVQEIIESTIIGPQVMGRHTDLHPLLVTISLFLFGYFMGFLGMLIAIPVAGLLLRWAMRWREKRHAEIEAEKVRADLEQNPHHASRSDQTVLKGSRA